MQQPWTLNFIWWITAVELPALAGLCWLIWRTRNDVDTNLDDARLHLESGLSHVREKLSAFKLEVAKSYVSTSYTSEH